MVLMGLGLIANSVALISDISSPNTHHAMIIISVVHMFVLAAGLYYLALGYEKDSAVFYRAFLILYAISNTVRLVYFMFRHSGFLPIAATTVTIIVVLVLLFVKDLGKQISWIAYGILIVAELLLLPSFLKAGTSATLLISKLSDLLIAGTLGLMINGKYLDKDARGTE
jgi:hypothetical protein